MLKVAVKSRPYNASIVISLRKQVYVNILQYFAAVKNVHFQMNFFIYIFLTFAQNIDCGYTLVPTIYVLEQNKKKIYPCKPQFYYIKVGCKGFFVTRTCFRDVILLPKSKLRGLSQ